MEKYKAKYEIFTSIAVIMGIIVFIVGLLGIFNNFNAFPDYSAKFFDKHEIFKLPLSSIELGLGGLIILQSIMIRQYEYRKEIEINRPFDVKQGEVIDNYYLSKKEN